MLKLFTEQKPKSNEEINLNRDKEGKYQKN